MSEDRIEKMLYEAKEKLPTTEAQWNIPEIAEEYYGDKNVRKRTYRLVKGLAVTAACLVIVFLSGNAVFYAMTGNSLIEAMNVFQGTWAQNGIEIKDIVINGNVGKLWDDYEKGIKSDVELDGSNVKIVSKFVNEKGWMEYEFEVNGNGIGMAFPKPQDPAHTSMIVYATGNSIGSIDYICEIKKDFWGRIKLYIGEEPIDITRDFADGYATGTIVETWGGLAGQRLTYTVEGTLEDNIIEVKWDTEE